MWCVCVCVCEMLAQRVATLLCLFAMLPMRVLCWGHGGRKQQFLENSPCCDVVMDGCVTGCSRRPI